MNTPNADYVRCPMCGLACLAVLTGGHVTFKCGNPSCDAVGVIYTPTGFDQAAWFKRWGGE